MVLKMIPQLETMRYSLKSKTWEEVGCPLEKRELISFSSDSVSINMNGRLHWLNWLPFQQSTKFTFSFFVFLVRSFV